MAALPLLAKELDVLSRTIWGEARGEPLLGKIAVAWVIRNRVTTDIHGDNKPDWWGEGVIGVCQKPSQFSCWNEHDNNLPKLLAVSADDDAAKESLYVALGVWLGYLSDPTAGATHYHATSVSPAWAKGKPGQQIGNHVFYQL